ncbi:hypothetical protein [Streptomyces sp. NPDC002564]|uniref:hypothetical protein n=1 Tax=Streptomyces sp. NPDC002564 TaxID=3364649 RepID=UPI0036CD5BE4
MTRQLLYAHALTAAAILLAAAGVFTAVVTVWWMAIFGLYGAAFFAWCARREYAINRYRRAEQLFGPARTTTSPHQDGAP